MWLTGKVDQSSQKESLFTELYQECKLAAPGARLSYSIRNRLERFQRDERREIACKMKDGCAPLFVACKKGNVEIVEYLLDTCAADVEQRGRYEVPDDRSVHNVTPLWCAAVAGRLSVVKCLVQHGANVNSMSDTGSTPVRSACFMTNLDIVRFLVESGADILKPNYNGGTCLINSVQSVPLCEFLLQHGAEVNATDIQSKTALHYAIQEHRLETTKLLLQYNADPFIQSRYGDDALQTACLKGATHIYELLISTVPYSMQRIAEAQELMGSTFLDDHHDIQMTLQFWRSAAQIRQLDPENPMLKPATPPVKAFQGVREFQTLEELESIALDLDELRIQSLLICHRVLGPAHKDTIFRLMYRGAAYADALQYQLCIDLWRYALELRVLKDSILFHETCFTVQAMVRLFLDLHEKQMARTLANQLHIEDIAATVGLLASHLEPCQKLLRIQPVFRKQQENFDRILKCLSHLFLLLTAIPMDDRQAGKIHYQVQSIVSLNLVTTHGESLLHLAVSKGNTIKNNAYAAEDASNSFFPNVKVVKLLLNCGANVGALDHKASTPLHVACRPANFKLEVVEALLNSGAHIDQWNADGERPSSMLNLIKSCSINPLQFTSLRCLAARVIVGHRIPYKGEVPASLEPFIAMH